MKKATRGFTLIEISFFLALTGALFVAIIVGTQNSLWQQKYNDSVTNFTNFLRTTYSQVSNPQGISEGRSDRAIYGRLIVFGENYDLKSERIPQGEQKIFVYDIVGDAQSVGTGSIKDILATLNLNVLEEEVENGAVVDVYPAGFTDSYSPTWNAVIERPFYTEGEDNNFKGSIMIVKHPRSGVINTLYSSRTIQVNETVRNARLAGNFESTKTLLSSKLDTFDIVGNSDDGDIDMCLNPYGMGHTGSFRRDIRIVKNSRSSVGVVIVDQDDPTSKCN